MKLKDKALELSDQLSGQARMEFIQWVMKEEDVNYETAYYICIGRTDPKEPEYTLGYKLADPVWQLALHGQRKKKREQARENFRKLLDEDELELFDKMDEEQVSADFKGALRRKKKEKGVKE